MAGPDRFCLLRRRSRRSSASWVSMSRVRSSSVSQRLSTRLKPFFLVLLLKTHTRERAVLSEEDGVGQPRLDLRPQVRGGLTANLFDQFICRWRILEDKHRGDHLCARGRDVPDRIPFLQTTKSANKRLVYSPLTRFAFLRVHCFSSLRRHGSRSSGGSSASSSQPHGTGGEPSQLASMKASRVTMIPAWVRAATSSVVPSAWWGAFTVASRWQARQNHKYRAAGYRDCRPPAPSRRPRHPSSGRLILLSFGPRPMHLRARVDEEIAHGGALYGNKFVVDVDFHLLLVAVVVRAATSSVAP